ncbi:MAG: hypothetical protein KGL39_42110, partial [Patescibacteria group bacterium]|nr:hypothetical protein [Patescibacteria group bacterium]
DEDPYLSHVGTATPQSVGMGFGAPAAGQSTALPQAVQPVQCSVCGQVHPPGMCPLADSVQNDPQNGAGPLGTPLIPQTVVTHMAGADDSDEMQEMVPRRHNEEHHDNRYEDGDDDQGWYEDWDRLKEDPDHPWVDDKGHELEPGGEYEMFSSQYTIPDKITVEAVTPDKLTYIIHAGKVDYRDELTLDDVENYGYSFRHATNDGTDSESGFDMEAENPPRQHLNLENPRQSAYPDCPACRQGLGWDGFTPHIPGCPEAIADTNGFANPQAAVPGSSIDPLPQQDDLSIPNTRQGSPMVDGMTSQPSEIPPCGRCGGSVFEHGNDGSCTDQGGYYQTERYEEPLTYPTQGVPAFKGPVASAPRTYTDALGNEMEYTGSFAGDNIDSRDWLYESSEVDVDPQLMAKFAGRDFAPREQREFIDEEGVGGPARNLHRLDLAGTHYELQPEEELFW